MPTTRPAALSAFLLLAACSSSEPGDAGADTQLPSTPAGSVVGVVTSAVTGAPLEGATAWVLDDLGAVVSDVTDAAGAYAITGLRAGVAYTVRFSKDGHVTRLQTATLDDSAGQFPSPGRTEVNVQLAPSTAAVAGQVRVAGAPAPGVTLVADLRGQGYDLVQRATTDAAGAYALCGLPGTNGGVQLPVVLEPWDPDADGVVDFGPGTFQAATYPGTRTALDLDLRALAVPLAVVASNIQAGSLASALPIEITYGRALDAGRTAAAVFDNTAGGFVSVAASADEASATVLTVRPTGATAWAANHSYTASVTAVASNGAQAILNHTFTATAALALLGPVSGVAVAPASTATDSGQRSFALAWSPILDAIAYQVWVRDDARNADWIRLATAGASLAPAASVTLPAAFDALAGDGLITPFALGTGVEFAVVAVNAVGEAPAPSTASPVTRRDRVAPLIAARGQSATFDRTAAGAATATLTLTFSELMDPSAPATLSGLAGGAAATWSLAPDALHGAFTVALPAGSSSAGIPLTLADARDSSGNPMAPVSFTAF